MLQVYQVGWTFNSSTGVLSGTPDLNSADLDITFTVQNPHSTKTQIHKIIVFNSTAFTAQLEIDPVGVVLGENPDNLAGLILYLDSSQLNEVNGSILEAWPDLSRFRASSG